MFNLEELTRDLIKWKKTKVMSHTLVNTLQSFIEVQVSAFGGGLEREDLIQQLWCFTIKLLPKVNIKMNIHSYILTSLKHQIFKEREEHNKRIKPLNLDNYLDDRKLWYREE
jgi:hypothetical protein